MRCDVWLRQLYKCISYSRSALLLQYCYERLCDLWFVYWIFPSSWIRHKNLTTLRSRRLDAGQTIGNFSCVSINCHLIESGILQNYKIMPEYYNKKKIFFLEIAKIVFVLRTNQLGRFSPWFVHIIISKKSLIALQWTAWSLVPFTLSFLLTSWGIKPQNSRKPTDTQAPAFCGRYMVLLRRA